MAGPFHIRASSWRADSRGPVGMRPGRVGRVYILIWTGSTNVVVLPVGGAGRRGSRAA